VRFLTHFCPFSATITSYLMKILIVVRYGNADFPLLNYQVEIKLETIPADMEQQSCACLRRLTRTMDFVLSHVQVVKRWVKQVARSKGFADSVVEGSSAKIFTFGSYRLGVRKFSHGLLARINFQSRDGWCRCLQTAGHRLKPPWAFVLSLLIHLMWQTNKAIDLEKHLPGQEARVRICWNRGFPS
jgi:hypothetical protein